jgi:hypothetical protein
MKIDKLISFGGPLLILLGVTKHLLYYQLFHINILPFLDLSEIVTSFLDSVVIGVLFIILFIFHQIRQPLFKQGWSEADITFRKYFDIIGLITLGIILCLFILIPIWKYGIYKYNVLSIASLIILIVSIRVGVSFVRGTAHEIYDTSSVIVLGLLLVGLLACKKFLSVKYGERYLGTMIVFENRPSIISDSTTYYIGNTTNYLFVFNEKFNRTYVYPMDDVKEISYKYRKKMFYEK